MVRTYYTYNYIITLLELYPQIKYYQIYSNLVFTKNFIFIIFQLKIVVIPLKTSILPQNIIGSQYTSFQSVLTSFRRENPLLLQERNISKLVRFSIANRYTTVWPRPPFGRRLRLQSGNGDESHVKRCARYAEIVETVRVSTEKNFIHKNREGRH